MERRTFLGMIAGGLLAAPLAAEAQKAGKVPRVGVLGVLSPEGSAPYASAFGEGLRALGYVEGQNVAIEWRHAHGNAERFPDLADELVRLRVDIIWAPNDPAIAAAQRATRTIPIVMMLARDPVAMGFVASLARPGGNITGLSTQAVDLVGKRLQLFREVVPKLSRLAVLFDPTEPGPPHPRWTNGIVLPTTETAPAPSRVIALNALSSSSGLRASTS